MLGGVDVNLHQPEPFDLHKPSPKWPIMCLVGR